MRILGVDPGTRKTGWGVVDCAGSRLTFVAAGVTASRAETIGERLAAIQAGLVKVLAEHQPEELGLERNFLARNVQSAFRLGEARGVILASAAAHSVAVFEYAPRTIKKAVAGYGGAEKSQVQGAVTRLLKLEETPAEDAADALATAICHALSRGFQSGVARALAATGRRR